MKVRFGLLVGLSVTTLFAAPAVFAAEKFYQVMGADGRLQTIVAPESADSSTDNETAKPPAKKGFWSFLRKSSQPAEKTTANAAESNQTKTPLAEAPKTPANPPAGWAPYDSEQYLDSEKIDKTEFNPEQKQRFYLLNDGSRMRVEEGLEPSSGESLSTPLPVIAHESGRLMRTLSGGYEEAEASEVIPHLVNNNCLSSDDVFEAKPLPDSTLRGVLLDKTTLAFIKPGKILAAFDFGWHQGGWLFLHSYASTERKPSFAQPLVVLTNEEGCVTRVLVNYFQRRYLATKTRYSELEGEIKLRPDEALLFFVIPQEMAKVQQQDYTVSRMGKLSIKWIR